MKRRASLCYRGFCLLINGDVRAMRRVHGFLVWFWIAVWIAGAVFDWLESVTFVSHLSAAALVLTSWGAWQATGAEQAAKGDR